MKSYDVSVLTPSYGYGRFIGEAARSAFGQPGLAIQHVVQDAGSRDETPTIVQAISGEYPGDVSWVSEPDRGQSDALNRALSRASGRWVGWLNADEFYLPGGLTALVQEGERSGADVVFADALFVDTGGSFMRLKSQHPFSHHVLHKYGTFIATCSTLIRRSALWPDPWDQELRLLMDRDLFMQLHQRGARFRYLRWPAAAFRVHDERVSAGTRESFSSDYGIVAERYGRVGPVGRITGRTLHVILKALSGGYLRAFRARNHRGADMSWASLVQGSELEDMVRRCYGVSALAHLRALQNRGVGAL